MRWRVSTTDIGKVCGVSYAVGEAIVCLSNSGNANVALAMLASLQGRRVISVPLPGCWVSYVETDALDELTFCVRHAFDDEQCNPGTLLAFIATPRDIREY